jgi:hypothetical protein
MFSVIMLETELSYFHFHSILLKYIYFSFGFQRSLCEDKNRAKNAHRHWRSLSHFRSITRKFARFFCVLWQNYFVIKIFLVRCFFACMVTAELRNFAHISQVISRRGLSVCFCYFFSRLFGTKM